MTESLPPSYFEDIYSQNPDPWQFETSPYEAAKYAATCAALPHAQYRNAFEIGCSIGVLTRQIAPRCAKLLSIDVSEQALARARERCNTMPQVRFAQMRIPAEFPPDSFDLILMSEVGYYLAQPDLERAIELIVTHLEPGGNLLLVHWTPVVHDYPLTGDRVHDLFIERGGDRLRLLHNSHTDRYRLDLFERV